jgi:oxygen-independent coproporphyrinogen III oxidase
LQKAIDLQPDHLSAYNLTIEPDTAFHKQQAQGQLEMPPDDFQRELFEIAIDTLTGAGYEHYEISNYAQPGKQCRHNLNYWVNGEYIGLGAGASSAFNGDRYKNVNLPARYITQINETQTAVESRETPDRRQRMGEAVMLGLRLKEGLNLSTFEKQFGISFYGAFGDTVTRLEGMRLLELRDDRAALTHEGLFLADSVIVEFITEPEKVT